MKAATSLIFSRFSEGSRCVPVRTSTAECETKSITSDGLSVLNQTDFGIAMQETQTCETCNHEFTYYRVRLNGRKRLFCGPECARKKRLLQNRTYRKTGRYRTRPRAAIHVRHCALCTNEFRTSNGGTRCCGSV